MQAASVSDIKKSLKKADPNTVIEICLQLARFKKDNKELISYLLFDADDEPAYINTVKEEMDDAFAEVNKSNLYFMKKNLRKILKNTTKYIRYTSSKTAEVELLIYFCQKIKSTELPVRKSPTLINMYTGVLKKIDAALSTLHEDLRHDYNTELKSIQKY